MKPFYITTTIPYVNAAPHIGFALEITQADVIARYKRLTGYEVFFNFGSDEHGQKIWQNATEAGVDPQAYTDEYAAKFKALKERLNLTYDVFIRTTDAKHKAAAQEMWKRCAAKGDIYKKNYEVKYCIGCELEKTDSELVDGKCPLHTNKPLEVRAEENYFFKLSAYQEQLKELYARTDFVVPDFRLNEIRSLIEGSGLQDFSISRLKSKMPWGVSVPGDETQVMYVWFDALVNYISTLNWPQDDTLFRKFWTGTTDSIQVAGKDQVRQQACMWQAMLMSAELPLSGQIFIHGFIMGAGGQKMSKSLGNVIDPITIVDEYSVDALRYFLLRHVHPTEDSEFTMELFSSAYTAGLTNGIGNLTARVMKLAEQYLDAPIEHPVQSGFPEEYQHALNAYEFNKACEYVWARIQALDQKIHNEEPFKVVKVDLEKGKVMLRDIAHELYLIARLLQPLLPQTSDVIKAAVLSNKKPENLFPRK
jgi:methionyl-tRNA synthetase